MRKVYHSRAFLNQGEGMAAYQASIGNESHTYKHEKTGRKTRYRSIYADFVISDCSRSVTLDFNIYGNTKRKLRRNLRNRLYKLGTLQKALDRFRKALVAEYNREARRK